MSQPYQTVLISFVSVLVLGTSLVFYRYVYPKKAIPPFYLMLLVSLLPLISILRPGSYESGDFNIHIYRTIAFIDAVRDGQILPSWAENLNATYGYPLFIFNYTLPYYLTSIFYILGFSFISSMKLFLAMNYLLSGIFMYICAKRLFKDDTAALVAAIFYQFAPYHLVDLHFKNAMGEVTAFTLIPLVFYLMLRLWESRTIPWLILTSISVAVLVMSHIVLAFFTTILIASYTFFVSYALKKTEVVFWFLAAFFLGAIFSIYVWMTPFFLSQYTVTKQFGPQQAFTELWMLFYSPWRLGFLFQGPNGELSPLLGYTQIICVAVLIYFMLRKKISKKYRRQIIFWIATFITIVFLITKYSNTVWASVPYLSSTGGSQRLIILAAFSSSILAGYLAIVLIKRKVIILILVAVTILTTILNWGHRRVIPEITDQFLIENIWKSTSESEGHWYANSKWTSKTNPWFSKLPPSNLEVIQGSADVETLSRNSVEHKYSVFAKEPTILRENTMYFPGWQASSNNEQINIYPDSEGVIRFQIPKGVHNIVVRYEDVSALNILKKISILSLSLAVLYLCLHGAGTILKRKSF